jgi:hypothetical protein
VLATARGLVFAGALDRVFSAYDASDRHAALEDTAQRKLQASIEQFGFVLPVVIDVDSRVIAGWGLAVAGSA